MLKRCFFGNENFAENLVNKLHPCNRCWRIEQQTSFKTFFQIYLEIKSKLKFQLIFHCYILCYSVKCLNRIFHYRIISFPLHVLSDQLKYSKSKSRPCLVTDSIHCGEPCVREDGDGTSQSSWSWWGPLLRAPSLYKPHAHSPQFVTSCCCHTSCGQHTRGCPGFLWGCAFQHCILSTASVTHTGNGSRACLCSRLTLFISFHSLLLLSGRSWALGLMPEHFL